MKNPLLKKRINIQCKCKKQILHEKDRVKFGVCKCDAYNMDHKLGIVLHNYMIQYISDASEHIVMNNVQELEKHAEAIKEYIDADSWDAISKKRGVKSKFLKKEKDFKKAMKYLVDNWHSFWW